MWDMHDGMGWWMVFGMIWVALFWGAIIWAIVWGISRTTGSHRTDDEPLEIARKRYARGDITRDQFEQLQRDLR